MALDLSGGTTVTLTARTDNGKPPSDEAMGQALDIIRERVNGAGVSEAEVSQQGDNVIVVAVPGTEGRRVAQQVGETAQLRFRQVLLAGQSSPPAPTPTPTGTATPGASPAATPTATPTASPTAQNRALGAALTGKAAPTPTPTPTPTASQPPADPSTMGDTSGVDPAVLAQFQRLNCAERNWQEKYKVTDTPNKQIATCDDQGVKYVLDKTSVEGKEISNAQAGLDSATGAQWVVNLDFNGTGTRQFGDVTTRVVNLQPPRNQVAIVLDGRVVSAPQINEPITGGTAQITGDFTEQEAKDLANVLKYGALPLEFEKSSIEEVSATLGSDQLRGGILAMIIGMVLVVLYCLLYYRALGLVAVFSLVVSAALAYEAVLLLGHNINFRLSLAGIAGLVVAIGITADSFIVYFERLRDEVRDGKSLRSAVERGWKRARRTIIVADVVSLLAAGVLYFLAIGGVKGFAFTLGLITLIDVVVVFLFTKPLVSLLARTTFFGQGHPLSGLDPKRLGVKSPIRGSRLTPKEAS
ncbi:MAG: protein translocase subunit SecD [Streptosporangiales bacterium]|nr:protein translocase subunit SecD [Streptosporangiales bacterium]